MIYVTCVTAIAAAASLLFAVSNFKRSKRLKIQLQKQEKTTEQHLLLIQLEIDRCTKDLAEREAAQKTALDSLGQITVRIDHIDQRHAEAQKSIDHLRGESTNLAILPTWHPTRVALANELRPRMAPITDQLVPVLFPNQIAFDELDWMYRLPDRKFPYSLTFEEGMLMHFLVSENGLKSGYEIATAFGFSSFFLATAFEKTGGHLISVDAYIEEEKEDFIYDHESTQAHVKQLTQLQLDEQNEKLPRGLQFAMNGVATLGIQGHVDYRIGCSPEGVPDLLDGQQLDFAFIDGGHFGEQPVLDVQSVLPYLNHQRFLMMFHDTQCEAVAKAVHFAAEATQTKPFSIHTRNRIVAVAKGIDEDVLARCREMTVRQAQ